jgi:hypothetical protein
MLRSGETPSDSRGCDQVVPEIGITATPVIDLTAGPRGTIYVVAMSKNATSYIQRMHALDLTTGAEQFGGPVLQCSIKCAKHIIRDLPGFYLCSHKFRFT